jgi:hypothetical protein
MRNQNRDDVKPKCPTHKDIELVTYIGSDPTNTVGYCYKCEAFHAW